MLIPRSKQQVEEAVNQLGYTLHGMLEKCSRPRENTLVSLRLAESIRQMITEINQAHMMWQVYITPLFNNLNRTIKATIYKFRNEQLNNFVQTLLTENNSIWKAASSIRGTYTF